MPAFTPLAATNEKSQLDAIWNEEDVEEQAPIVKNRPFIAKIFNDSIAQHAKLIVLAILAMIHFYYLNDFLRKFAVYERLAIDVKYVKAHGSNYRNDMEYIQYTLQALVDYKKNLWLTVGAMCASLAATASLLTTYSGPKETYNRTAMILIRIFDYLVFLFITFLLFARISCAIVLVVNAEKSLLAAQRISPIIYKELEHSLNCVLDGFVPQVSCTNEIIESAFPIHFIEYLVILCILTAAYIGLAYLIQWCIRHFFPPTHQKLSPISAISRNLVGPSRCSSDNSVLIAA